MSLRKDDERHTGRLAAINSARPPRTTIRLFPRPERPGEGERARRRSASIRTRQVEKERERREETHQQSKKTTTKERNTKISDPITSLGFP